MPAVGTGQMSAAETGQMSSVARTDICVLSQHTMLKSQKSQLWQCDNNIAAAGGRLIGSLGSILAVLGRGTGPKREKMAGRSLGTDSQDLAMILDPFRSILVDLGPDRLSAT